MKAAWYAFAVGGVLALAAARRRGLAPYTLGDVATGCERELASLPATPANVAGYNAIAAYLRHVDKVTGVPKSDVAGWHRPEACNERRGGAPRSRHLEGWAADIRPTPQQLSALLAHLEAGGSVRRSGAGYQPVYQRRAGARVTPWGDAVRRATGHGGGVGLRVYESGVVHVDLGCPEDVAGCDPRRDDWIEILWRTR